MIILLGLGVIGWGLYDQHKKKMLQPVDKADSGAKDALGGINNMAPASVKIINDETGMPAPVVKLDVLGKPPPASNSASNPGVAVSTPSYFDTGAQYFDPPHGATVSASEAKKAHNAAAEEKADPYFGERK